MVQLFCFTIVIVVFIVIRDPGLVNWQPTNEMAEINKVICT